MGIGFGGGDWLTPEERLMKDHLEDSPMGMGDADYHDEIRATIAQLKEEGVDLSELTYEDVRKIHFERKVPW